MQVNLSNLIAAQIARPTASQPAARVQTSSTPTPVTKPDADTTVGQLKAETSVTPVRIGAKIDIRV